MMGWDGMGWDCERDSVDMRIRISCEGGRGLDGESRGGMCV